MYVAILGGVLAVAPIAFLNADLLGASKKARWVIVAAGAVGAAALVAYAAVGGVRVGAQLIGLAAWIPMYLIQRPWDRIHSAFGPDDDDDAYESLLGPGLLAVIAGGATQGAILSGVSGA